MPVHLVAAADLLVGAACAGCGRPALAVCWRCAERIRPEPFVVTTARRASHVAIVAAGPHHGTLGRVVVDWKERGRFPLTEVLSHHLAAAVAASSDAEEVCLVPVPTSWSARWRRGDDLVLSLARAAADRLDGVGQRAVVCPVLRRTRRTADQAGLGAGDRARNLRGAFSLDRRLLPQDTPIVLVDDVVTTGSTLAEAFRALAVRGWSVHGAATVGATAPRRAVRDPSGL